MLILEFRIFLLIIIIMEEIISNDTNLIYRFTFLSYYKLISHIDLLSCVTLSNTYEKDSKFCEIDKLIVYFAQI